jgi:hypothetical protein
MTKTAKPISIKSCQLYLVLCFVFAGFGHALGADTIPLSELRGYSITAEWVVERTYTRIRGNETREMDNKTRYVGYNIYFRQRKTV